MLYSQLPPERKDSSNGDFIVATNHSKALTLIETLVTLLISSVIIGIVSLSFPSLKRLSAQFARQALFMKQYYIFLLIFEEDYQQAELTGSADLDGLDSLIFRVDMNRDGDFADAGESITYRWNSKRRRIDRKSGRAAFQSLLEGLNSFSWHRSNGNPVCHELKITDALSLKERSINFCRREHL